MADDLGDEWWQEAAADEEPVKEGKESAESDEEPKPKKTKKADQAAKKKKKQVKECILRKPEEIMEPTPKKSRKRKKKTITDVLATSEPKPGTPEDLQRLIEQHYKKTRSVIEMEELRLPGYIALNECNEEGKRKCYYSTRRSRNHRSPPAEAELQGNVFHCNWGSYGCHSYSTKGFNLA